MRYRSSTEGMLDRECYGGTSVSGTVRRDQSDANRTQHPASAKPQTRADDDWLVGAGGEWREMANELKASSALMRCPNLNKGDGCTV